MVDILVFPAVGVQKLPYNIFGFEFVWGVGREVKIRVRTVLFQKHILHIFVISIFKLFIDLFIFPGFWFVEIKVCYFWIVASYFKG